MTAAGPQSGKSKRVHAIWHGVYGVRRKIATSGAVVLAAVVGYHVIFGQNGLTAYRSKRQTIHDMNVEMRDLQNKNQTLHNHVQRLASDPSAIEHEAREALHYTRPGEVIYTLPEEGKR